MTLSLHRIELPLEHPFTIARGTKTVQRCLIVELEHSEVRFRGYGEQRSMLLQAYAGFSNRIDRTQSSDH